MKKNKVRKLIGIFLLILVSLPIFAFFGSSVNAQLTTNSEMDIFMQEAANNLGNIFKGLRKVSTGGSLFKSLTGLLGAIAFSVFSGFCVMFSGVTGSVPATPDNIIFNKVAILDINFFNPYPNSLIGMLSGTIAKIYNSFDTIALTLFVLCAMVVAIKMVLSSVAAQKAEAKNALKHWVTGIVLLLLMRVIIAGIFELNEIIVSNLSGAAEQVTFNIDLTGMADDNMGFLDWVGGLFNLQTYRRGIIAVGGLIAGSQQVPGYLGMLAYFACYGWVAQDLFAVILFFTIFGQSITLLVSYGKRLMYTVLLGVAAPIVVVIDALNKITKGSSNILNNWFKEFTAAVFMQSFHAVMLVVILNMIAAIVGNSQNGSMDSALVGVICIALSSGLIRFEKFYKQIFGLQDGVVGGLKSSAGKVMLGLNAAKTGVKAIADNGSKLKNAYKSKNEAKQQRNEAVKSRGAIYSENAFNVLALANELASSNPTGSKELAYKAREYYEKAKADGYDIPEEKYQHINRIIDMIERGGVSSNGTVPIGVAAAQVNGGNTAGSNSGNVNSGNVNSGQGGVFSAPNSTFEVDNQSTQRIETANVGSTTTTARSGNNDESLKTQKDIAKDLQQLRREITSNNRMETNIAAKNKEIAKAEKQIKEANANLVSAGLATAMGPANLIAGVGMGIGAGSDLISALNGGYVTAALDSAAEHAGRTIGKAVNAQFDKHAKVDDTN